MNTSAVLRSSGSFFGPLGLVLGGSLVTLAVVGTSHQAGQVAAGPQPTPTATTSSPPKAVKSSKKPAPATHGPAAGTRDVAVLTSTGQRLNPASAHKSHASKAPSRPVTHPSTPVKPTPPTQPPVTAAACTGKLLAVSLIGQCVSLGGN